MKMKKFWQRKLKRRTVLADVPGTVRIEHAAPHRWFSGLATALLTCGCGVAVATFPELAQPFSSPLSTNTGKLIQATVSGGYLLQLILASPTFLSGSKTVQPGQVSPLSVIGAISRHSPCFTTTTGRKPFAAQQSQQ
ncbi:MAG: hypothetical protein R3E95_16660 [Thiolinea sp.]